MRRLLVLVLCVCASAVALAQTPAPKLRLPTIVVPVSYSADLTDTPGQDKFRGAVTIELSVREATPIFWIHAKELEFSELSLQVDGSTLAATSESAPNDLVAIKPAHPLLPGSATLRIAYSGTVSRSLTDGAFQQVQSNNWYVFTKFEPITARRVFPCFDEPSFKTPWRLTLHVPADLKAFSNTNIESERNESASTKAVSFHTTKPLPSYLVAFAVGPFDVVETSPVGRNRVVSRIIIPRGRASEARHAASITPKLIDLLENYFGTPYPYEKLDQVVVPLTTAWGAMENAGLIAYGDFLLSPLEADTELRERSRAATMEHEMSHQWFGNLVTIAWWDDIWLNEAFASWIELKLLDEWHPDWQLRADSARSIAVFRADSLTTSRKIRQPIESPGDIGTAFDGITYGKGQAVIQMFEHYVGADPFRQAVRLYLQQHAWGNATSADLLAAIDQTVPNEGIGAAFSTFLNQTGFPLINATILCPSNAAATVKFEQQRFMPFGSGPRLSAGGTASSQPQLWQVPVCYEFGDELGQHRDCTLLKTRSADVPLIGAQACPLWLFADGHAAGYYAVNYPANQEKQLLIHGLRHLSAAESAALLRNVQINFSSGLGSEQQELSTAAAFASSGDLGLVRQSAVILAGIDEWVAHAQRGAYAERLRELYGDRAHQLTWLPRPAELYEVRQLRIELLPLITNQGEDEELVGQARLIAQRWLKNHSTLDPDLVEPLLYAVAAHSGREFFNQLVAGIRSTPIQRERAWMIAALNAFRDPVLNRSALDLLFDPSLDPRELRILLFSSNPETRQDVLDFTKQNFDRLNARLPSARGVPFAATLPNVAAAFCDAAHRADTDSYFSPRVTPLPGGTRNLDNTLERISLCAARAPLAKQAVANFLQ